METHSFQAEVQSLLNLMIHSLYSNKEIFLRELISNASDALDKYRFEELTNKNLTPSSREPGIKITLSKEPNKLIIEDNGIGMTKEELVANLGTIANSGTKKFLKNLSDADKKDSQLIGQFGVGFYAAFMVAENITVESLSAHGGPASIWTSQGTGSFTIGEGTRTERGSRVEITLKPEESEFAEEWRIKGLVTKYSDYITYQILDEKDERLNKSTPVWARNKKEVKPEEYNDLYKQISKDYQNPMLHEHISVEGTTSFQAVVFVPNDVPVDLWQRDTNGLHLYVKRVSIMEKCAELLPEYLRFVKGVVETDDIPLNVSREILQSNTKLPAVKKQVVKKILNNLVNLADNKPEDYIKFYSLFGAVLKEGFHFDHDNHETLSKLVRFKSSKETTEWVTLEGYVSRMVEGQKEIYYATGPTAESIAKSPHLESLVKKDIEVLFLTDHIDEWFVMDYPKHGEFELTNIAKGALDLTGVGKETDATEAQKSEVSAEDLAPLLAQIKEHLASEIKEVRVTKRLTESACCLVADESGMSAQLERMMKAANKDFVSGKKILEINASHNLIKNLAELQKKTPSAIQDWIDVLYETAVLSEGSTLKNPGDFAKKLTKLMESASAH